jgi:mandelamide amidase
MGILLLKISSYTFQPELMASGHFMSTSNTATDDILSSEELVKESFAAAKTHESLSAFIYLNSDAALEKARMADIAFQKGEFLGPLHGVPIVVKDNIHVAGMTNTAGTPALRNYIPDTSNPVVETLVNAGAIVVAKTNMHELAFGITSNNAAFGTVRNAHNPEMISGGSSGGTAVAIAAGVVEMGLGTDTGGSCRIPATLNGVVGFRPTIGRYDSNSVTPLSSTRDTVGPFANTIHNAALLDSVITGVDIGIAPAKLKGLRLGTPKHYFYENLSADVSDNIKQVLSVLTAAGVELIDVDLPNLEATNEAISFPVALHEFITELPIYLKKYNTNVSWDELVAGVASLDVKNAINMQLSDEAIPEAAYIQAIEHFRPLLQDIYAKAFSTYNVDAFIVPATPCVAQPIATSDETVLLNGEQLPTFNTYIRNVDPSSNAGLPSLAFPSGFSESGLPIGILLDGPKNSDRRLFEIGKAIETLLSANKLTTQQKAQSLI